MPPPRGQVTVASRVEGRRVTGRGSVADPALSHRAAVRSPWARFLPRPLRTRACRFPAPGSPVKSCGSHTGFPVATSGRVARAVAPGSHPCAGRAGASSDLLTPRRRRPLGSSPSLMHVMTSGIAAHHRGTRPSATPVSLLPFAIASTCGPFPPPALPGFTGTTGPLRHPVRPDLALTGRRLARAAPPAGLPVLRSSPSSMRAAAITPAEPVGARVAHFPTAGSLPRYSGGSASALPVSRPARRS